MNATVIADYRVSDKCTARLTELGFGVIRLPCFRGLVRPVFAHPDMLIFPANDGFLLPCEYYLSNQEFFDRIPCRWIPVSRCPGREYPDDVPLNALCIGDTVYGKEGAVADEILSRYPRFVPVSQGYARCSVAVLDQTACITPDIGIARALMRDGIDVLQIQPGHIDLPGYDYGFIGGAGGNLGDRRYAFFGDYRMHPEASRIEAFAKDHSITLISLSDGRLSDHGGLVLI